MDDERKSIKHLILDCEYEIETGENGFVLKWFLNNKQIYQWIPPIRQPQGFFQFKNRVNRTFTVSDIEMHKHRALAIVKPIRNFTGEYACSVQTFQSNDKKSAYLQMIVPESEFYLKYRRDESNHVLIQCSAYDMSPEPQLTLWINEHQLENTTIRTKEDGDGLYATITTIKLILYEMIQPEDAIKCMLSIPGTDYRKTKETVYLGT